MTQDGITKILSLFEELLGAKYSPTQVLLWRKILQDVDDTLGYAAAVQVCKESVYEPKPADIYKRAFPSKPSPAEEDRMLDEESDHAIAWMRDHINNDYGVDFGPLLNAVIRAYGGLQAVIDTFLDDRWSYERPRWVRLYKGIARRGVNGSEGDRLLTSRYTEHIAQVHVRGDQQAVMAPQITTNVFEPHTHGLNHLPGRGLILGQNKGLLDHSGGE